MIATLTAIGFACVSSYLGVRLERMTRSRNEYRTEKRAADHRNAVRKRRYTLALETVLAEAVDKEIGKDEHTDADRYRVRLEHVIAKVAGELDEIAR
ncbi:hypothetical protein NRB36_004303 [Salmonella enterica]|nr:hypothetical protein [Salmonella enterica]EJO1639662.1 hypothetical protein [Salmonella enterica]